MATEFATGSNDLASAVALQANGKIVAAGFASFAFDSSAALARYITAHERAILELIDLEIADPAGDSSGPVAKLLANPPTRA